MAESSTSICNMALARLGGRRIDDYSDATNTSLEAIYCRLFFEQTAKALMKDHYWPFAKDRVQLSQTDAVAFQWDYAYLLPNDYLRWVLVYNGADNPQERTEYSFEIEGRRLLSDEDAIYLKYIRWVDNVGDWDDFFIEADVLFLARKLVIPLSQDVKLKADVDRDIDKLMPKIRAMDRMEQECIGRMDLRTWREGRYSDTA